MYFGKNRPEKYNINKQKLRHSFETILLEDSTNLLYIQEILGYAYSQTIKICNSEDVKILGKIINPLVIIKLMEG